MWLIDRYKILKEIGRGGTSIVVLVFDKVEQQKYAIKILKKNSAKFSSNMIKQIFLKEVSCLEKLDDFRICNLKHAFEDSENLYIVMDYIDGIALTNFIKKGMDEITVCNLMFKLIDIIQYIHARGVYHMDIKPQNILLNKHKVYLIDFGSSRLLTDDTKVLCTTPAYTSAEILTGDLPDETTDIYSFGITFYVLLYQCLPSVHRVDSYLANFLLTCCSVYKDERYQTCMEAKQHLCKIVNLSIHGT